jgi:hypothetical protein
MTLTRNASNGIDFYAALVRSSDGVLFAAFTGSDLAPATFTFNRVGLRAGDALDADSIKITECTVVAGRAPQPGNAPSTRAMGLK